MSNLFYTLLLITTLPIVNCIVNPQRFQIQAAIDAKSRGWSTLSIWVTRAFQYFTLYAQIWTLIAICTEVPTTIHLAHSLSWLVFVAYHGINLVDAEHLSYHPPELTRIVTGWKPPMSILIIPFIGLHLQHTIFPFYLYSIHQPASWGDLFLAHKALFLYIRWHLVCWEVQGIPAYPFLSRLRRDGWETSFYVLGFGLLGMIQYLNI